MLSFIYQTRMLPAGVYLVWLIFLCSWGSDTCAYCVGMLIGRHKMSPKLSPKKSVEGAVGGVVGAALLTALYGTVFRQAMEITTAGSLGAGGHRRSRSADFHGGGSGRFRHQAKL